MLINKLDNVEVNVKDGHKYAVCDIKKGENVIKYGSPIGHATEDIKKGEHVHTHNVKTNLSSVLEYVYEPEFYDVKKETEERFFLGFERENGDVGIRNEIW
ncbi:MAG: altronate dehydratase, partial [Clostridia bacterium]|nr:altronate dehydratase [Clostridia bacterium]